MIKIRILAATLLMTGVLILVGGMSLAQQDQNMNANTGDRTGTNANRGGSGQGNSSAMARSADGKFMMTAAAGGMAEVEMARLATQQAASDAVRQYAQQMIADHTKANDELMQIAAAKGITLPAGPDAKHLSLMERLRRATGAEFDRLYMREAGVKDHQDMQKLFQNEANKGKDADVKAFASKTLPTVQAHLSMARDMSATMKGGGGQTGGNMNGNGNSNMNRNGNTNRNGNANTNSNNMNGDNTNANMSGNSNNGNMSH